MEEAQIVSPAEAESAPAETVPADAEAAGRREAFESLTVMQYGDWIQMSDLLEMSAVDNNVLQATRLLGAQAGRTLDSITRDVLAGGTNVIYAPSHANGTTVAVTSRSAIDESCRLDGDLIFRAAAQLKGMNAEPIAEVLESSQREDEKLVVLSENRGQRRVRDYGAVGKL